MTKLSVNVNKFATLRNARGGNNPDLVQIVKDCQKFGALGITVHPRPDERHITRDDVFRIKDVVTTEYNIEGYPDERYLRIIEQIRPDQATLVPDPPDVLTSNAGWDTVENAAFLKDMIAQIKSFGVRVSIFINPDTAMIEAAAKTGTDRVELYTESYATEFRNDPESAIKPYLECGLLTKDLGMGLNAGHDLDSENLKFMKEKIPFIDEVSIGHALVCDSLYWGLENTIQTYLKSLDSFSVPIVG